MNEIESQDGEAQGIVEKGIGHQDVEKDRLAVEVAGTSVGADAKLKGINLSDWDLDYLVKNEVHKASMCSAKYKVFETPDGQGHRCILMRCSRWFCTTCGGKGGVIHGKRMESVFNRLDIESVAMGQYVFTLPPQLWPHLQNKHILNLYYGMIHNLIERFFGEPKVCSKSKGPKYRLNKGVIAYIHLMGGKPYFDPEKFKPHVNVHIIEKKSELKSPADLDFSHASMDEIRKTYLRYLIKFCEKHSLLPQDELSGLPLPKILYEPKYTPYQVFQAIRYMTRPMDINTLDTMMGKWNSQQRYFLVCGMKRYRYTRFWGRISDTKYREYLSYLTDGPIIAPKGKEPLGYKFLGYMTEKEVENLLQDKSSFAAVS